MFGNISAEEELKFKKEELKILKDKVKTEKLKAKQLRDSEISKRKQHLTTVGLAVKNIQVAIKKYRKMNKTDQANSKVIEEILSIIDQSVPQ